MYKVMANLSVREKLCFECSTLISSKIVHVFLVSHFLSIPRCPLNGG